MALWTMISINLYINVYYIKYIQQGDFYVNIFMLMLAEFSGFFTTRFLFERIGTKILFFMSQLISVIGAIGMIFLLKTSEGIDDDKYL